MKKLLLLLVVVVVASMICSFSLVSCKEVAEEEVAEEEVAEVTKTIGFVVSTLANPYFVSMKEGGEEKAAELGIEMIILDAQDSSEKQSSQIEDLIASNVDVIILNPTDSDAVVTGVKEANEAGIPVITITRPSNGGKVAQHIDTDDTVAGNLAAEEMAKVLGGKGKVAILEGIAGAPSAAKRQSGFMEVIENYPDIEVVSSLTANYSREEGASVMEDVLQANPELDGVFAHNDEMALGAVRAIDAAGRLDEIKVIGVDATDDAIEAIKAGEMLATARQKQGPGEMLGFAVESAFALMNGEEVEEHISVPYELVDKNNI